MSIILRLGAVKPTCGYEPRYGSGDEASTSYSDGDVLDIPLPEHTYQRPLPPTNVQTSSAQGCFGLPYQDHNYGMAPPPSPPRPATPDPPSPLQVNGVVQMEEEVKTSMPVSVVEEVVEDSVTRCICGYLHDDGYMICCDKCSVWQHIDCMGVDRNNIPDSYFCELCEPRILDAVQAKIIQKRKREELAARNVLSDSSATDTDPEEAANAMASMGKKLPINKKKNLKKRKTKEKKIKKSVIEKRTVRKLGRKEKENIKTTVKQRKQQVKTRKMKMKKSQPLSLLEQSTLDPWDSNGSPWIDSYDYATETQYSQSVREFCRRSQILAQSENVSTVLKRSHIPPVEVTEVKKSRKGLQSTEIIPAGQAIIEYRGSVVSKQDYDDELVNSNMKLQPFVLFYKKLEDELCVDARNYGNDSRFVRRSCTPNAEIQHFQWHGNVSFLIVSTKDIMMGAEVTIPFDYNYQDCLFCIECACVRGNCPVSRFWKKIKNSEKSVTKEIKSRKRHSSNADSGGSVNVIGAGTNGKKAANDSKPSSPVKVSTTPVKCPLPSAKSPVKMSSPVKLSNVSTLLAASALLDGQLDVAEQLKLGVANVLQKPIVTPYPAATPAKSTHSRRSSKVVEDIVKDEKQTLNNSNSILHSPVKKEKKEPKNKDKESKEPVHHPPEIKRERKNSTRRSSQEGEEEEIDVAFNSQHSSGEDTYDKKKMTREERKLDAIMKAFEKMEKREERKKEAAARSETHTRKTSVEGKSKKKDEIKTEPTNSTVNQDVTVTEEEGEEEEKVEPVEPVVEPLDVTSVKKEDEVSPTDLQSPPPSSTGGSGGSGGGGTAAVAINQTSTTSQPLSSVISEPKTVAESPQKFVRKGGKRKRRRSRVQSATAVLADSFTPSSDEQTIISPGSSIPATPVAQSVPSTPNLAPSHTPTFDLTAAEFKYKTKKHLFNEWSTKHEDESSNKQEEMFVQCLPNSHANAMDHLKRRHSQCIPLTKGIESSAGSAKKRWLRQAMHEAPSSTIVGSLNHSLSVSTDSGSASPVHVNGSPNPGFSLNSPGAGSPVDFVTPLKKRRLMRESLSSNGPLSSMNGGGGLLVDSVPSNGIAVTSRTNGIKPVFPLHRHSTDDRLLLHKNFAHRNGFTESVTLQEMEHTATSSTSAVNNHITETSQKLLTSMVNSSSPVVNGFSEPSVVPPLLSSRKLQLGLRDIFEKMEVDSNDVSTTEKSSTTSPNGPLRLENNIVANVNTLYSNLRKPEPSDEAVIDSSAPSSCVIVNGPKVNSVYNGSGEEEREAGCLTTKSILNDDSPAIVRVDLNAHDIEPSSLHTDSVSIRTQLFPSSSTSSPIKTIESENECLVNSTEDVSNHSALNLRNCDTVGVELDGSTTRNSVEVESSLRMETEEIDSARLNSLTSSKPIPEPKESSREEMEETEEPFVAVVSGSDVSVNMDGAEAISSSCADVQHIQNRESDSTAPSVVVSESTELEEENVVASMESESQMCSSVNIVSSVEPLDVKADSTSSEVVKTQQEKPDNSSQLENQFSVSTESEVTEVSMIISSSSTDVPTDKENGHTSDTDSAIASSQICSEDDIRIEVCSSNVSETNLETASSTNDTLSSSAVSNSALTCGLSVIASTSAPFLPSSPSSSGHSEDVQSLCTLSPVSLSSTPQLSTSEAIPAVKKKVSLLEYRKRLKEKPTTCSGEVTSPPSSSQQSKNLSPSEITLSSSSLAFLASASTSPSRSARARAEKLPTLATLPLFKTADDKGKGKQQKEQKKKVEKQLSLSDRLRLEFGLEDSNEDKSRKQESRSKTARRFTLPSTDMDGKPPPPPSHPPPQQPASANLSSTNSTVDSTQDVDIPPPPPLQAKTTVPFLNKTTGKFLFQTGGLKQLSSNSSLPTCGHAVNRERLNSFPSGRPLHPYSQCSLQQQPLNTLGAAHPTSSPHHHHHHHHHQQQQQQQQHYHQQHSQVRPNSFSFDYNNHRSNSIADDRPPPPPPPLPLPSSSIVQTSPLSSSMPGSGIGSASSVRYPNSHHRSLGKSKNSVKAASSSSSSSISSSSSSSFSFTHGKHSC